MSLLHFQLCFQDKSRKSFWCIFKARSFVIIYATFFLHNKSCGKSCVVFCCIFNATTLAILFAVFLIEEILHSQFFFFFFLVEEVLWYFLLCFWYTKSYFKNSERIFKISILCFWKYASRLSYFQKVYQERKCCALESSQKHFRKNEGIG